MVNDTNHDKLIEALHHSNLMLVASELAKTCLIHGKQPEDAVDVYQRTYGLLEDWYSGEPLKEQIGNILKVLLPETYTGFE